MAVGVSFGVFKSWLLLRVETNFYIVTGVGFKGLILGAARFASLDLGARVCFHPFLPIWPPGPVCLCRVEELGIGICRVLAAVEKQYFPAAGGLITPAICPDADGTRRTGPL